MQSKVAKRSSRTYVQLLRFQLLGLPIHNVLLHHAIAAFVDVLGDKKSISNMATMEKPTKMDMMLPMVPVNWKNSIQLAIGRV